MRKVYTYLLALGVAAMSLSSCSRATYSFNNSVPAYLGSEHVQPVAKATPVATAPALPATPVAAAPAAAATLAPATNAPAIVAKAAPAPAAQVAPAAPAEAVATAPAAKPAKPSLMQRLALKKLAKMQQKQATAGTEHTAASKLGRAALITLAGLLLAIIGLLIAGGSLSGGSGAGFAIGIVLYYVGAIAFIVGLVLVIIALINGA